MSTHIERVEAAWAEANDAFRNVPERLPTDAREALFEAVAFHRAAILLINSRGQRSDLMNTMIMTANDKVAVRVESVRMIAEQELLNTIAVLRSAGFKVELP